MPKPKICFIKSIHLFLIHFIPGVIVITNYYILARFNLTRSDLAFFAFCWLLPLACFGVGTSYLLRFRQNKKLMNFLFFFEHLVAIIVFFRTIGLVTQSTR